jgi:guanylate kinase
VSREGIVFVVSGPSGVGKTSILRRALESESGLQFSVSHTTRAPRDGEAAGSHYHFVSEAEFRTLIEQRAFLEHAEYQGHMYGTSLASVEGPVRAGIDLILEVEVQGAAQLRERLPEAATVFVLPPSSMTELEARLRGRGSDDETVIAKRLEIAKQEIREAEHYRYLIINENLEQATEDFLLIVRAARLESRRVLATWREQFDAD